MEARIDEIGAGVYRLSIFVPDVAPTGTLLCGDLFSRVGNGPAITESDILEQSIQTESSFHYTSLGPTTGSTVRSLAALKPKVLATMHGSSFSGDGATALTALGDHYDALLRTALADRKLT